MPRSPGPRLCWDSSVQRDLPRFSKTATRALPSFPAMNDNHRQINFETVQDAYAEYGLQDHGEARYLRADLGAETVGVTLYQLRPGKRTGFAHRHQKVEELYIVLSGTGRMKVDDDVLGLRERDVVRVAPSSVRDFEAGPEGLELLATGGHVAGDGEMVEDWWPPEAA